VGAGRRWACIGAAGDRGAAVGGVADRLNQAPEKNELAFLGMLGVSLLPAQPARAPVTFTPRTGLGDSRVPAATQVGATVPGVTGPLIFETERDIALAAAPLVEVAAVLPGTDQWATYTDAYASRQPFTLFDGAQPVGHELYLAHDVHFALQGHCQVLVQLELAATAGRRIDTVWEYWDGDGWRRFASFKPATMATDSDSIDGTNGLTRSGTVLLRVDGATAKRRVVNWVDSFWIRARAADPLTPDYAAQLPTVDRVLVASVVELPTGSLVLTDFKNPIPANWAATSPLTVVGWPTVPLSADPGSASVSITQVNPPSGKTPYTDSRPLAGGYAQLDNIPDGTYEFQVLIPGFTTATAPVTIGAGGAGPSQVWVDYTPTDRTPDKGAAGSLALDLTKPFYPFGSSAQPGATCYLMLTDALSKPGATVTMMIQAASTGLEDTGGSALPVTLDAQYFDGEQWRSLDNITEVGSSGGWGSEIFTQDFTTLQFPVPADCAVTTVNDVSGYWIRFRITSGTYGTTRAVTVPSPTADDPSATTTLTLRELVSPAVKALRYSYYYRSLAVAPTACQTCNDFSWVDHSAGLATRGTPFPPFSLVTDPTTALYFGFDAPLPEDVLSVYLDVTEPADTESGPALLWECLDAGTWVPMSVEDETVNLALPGAVRISYPGVTALPSVSGMQLGPDNSSVRCTDPTGTGLLRVGDVVSIGDNTGTELALIATIAGGVITFTAPTAKSYPRATVTRAGPPRFGTPRAAWIRARLRNDGDPITPTLGGVYPNTAWAARVQTQSDEVLGTSDGNPGQSMSFAYTPVLPGERVEVLELSGARAEVDLADLRDDVLAHGGTDDDLRKVPDPKTGMITQVWVTWAAQRNLYFSGPTDRHYMLERSSGLIIFGDDRHGRIPPIATDGIHARVYQAGGGSSGNVAAGAITQLLSGVPAASVVNVGAAEGGADNETALRTGAGDGDPADQLPPEVLRRGPVSVAARSQALTAADYETLAREATPAVAVARAVPATDPTGRLRPGFVRLIIMPDSADPRPAPSFGLRRQVEQYLRRRCPASMAGQVYVAAPDYQAVGVFAEVVPSDPDSGGPVVDAVKAATAAFLHPLTGGPEGTGWAFGRDVYLSDLARVMGGVPGVDHIRTLELLLDGTPHGQVVTVPPGRIVVAGDLSAIRLAGGE
jgi:hypothetical protein